MLTHLYIVHTRCIRVRSKNITIWPELLLYLLRFTAKLAFYIRVLVFIFVVSSTAIKNENNVYTGMT